MPKKLWNKCQCGIITDADEKECPGKGLEDNPGHKLELVGLDEEELKQFVKAGKVYTKHHSKSPP